MGENQKKLDSFGGPDLLRITVKPTTIEAKKSNAWAREQRKIDGWEEDVWATWSIANESLDRLAYLISRSRRQAVNLDNRLRKRYGMPVRPVEHKLNIKEGRRVAGNLLKAAQKLRR